MSTIEKLFVQIFDRKRKIIEQLNHQKQLYDQNLASKLLIQGITPPPWLLNSDNLSSSSTSASDPKDLNKEELISGLLLPFPQPQPSFSDANLYVKPLSTVTNGELQHDVINDTSARCQGTDGCRPGVLPQCLFRGLEDVHHDAADTPQEKVLSGNLADPDQSVARMQRSKSRQKALELRSSGKAGVKYQLEDNPPTGPGRQDALKEGMTTTAGILSSSKDKSILRKQEISRKEGKDFRSATNETDASTNWLTPHSESRDFPTEESLVAANSPSCKGGSPRQLLKEPVIGTDGSSYSNLLTEELIENQGISCIEEDIYGRCTKEVDNPSNLGGTSYIFQEGPSYDPFVRCIETEPLEACDDDVVQAFEVNRTSEPSLSDHLIGHQATRDSSLQIPLQATSPGLPSLAAKSGELFSKQCNHTSQPGQGSTEGGLSCGSIDNVRCLLKPSDCVYSVQGKLDANSLDINKIERGESAAEPASAHSLSNLIASQVLNLPAEEPILQDEVVSSQRMQLANESSRKNKLQGDGYSGESKHDTDSLEVHIIQEGECPTEVPTSQGLSNEIASQLVHLSAQEHSYQLQVEHLTSVSSERVEFVIGSTEKKILQEGERYSREREVGTSSSDKINTHIEEIQAEVASTHGLSAVKMVNISLENHTPQLEVEHPNSLASDSPGKLKKREGESLVEDLSPEEHTPQLEVEQPNSLASKRFRHDSKRFKHATDSCGNHEVPGESPQAGESLVEAVSTHVISNQLEGLPLEEFFPQLEVEHSNSLSSKRLKHATNSSNEVPGESPRARESLVEAASTHVLSNVTSGQSEDLSSEEHIPQLEVEHPNSLSLESMKHVIDSSRKHEEPGENPVEGFFVDSRLHMVGDPQGTLSSAKLNTKLVSDHHIYVYSEESRKSQGRNEVSIEQCNTEVRFSQCRKSAEWSGATENELATSITEDHMKDVSVRQKLKLDDIQAEAAEPQATCFSKEVKYPVSPKTCELQTLCIDSSSTSPVGGSWPRQKRRKIDSMTTKSASPNLRVSSNINVAKSCTGVFSATRPTRTTQNDSSLRILPEHSSKMHHEEEMVSFRGSSDVELEKLQVYGVSSPSQLLGALSNECLHEVDLTREMCDFSSSISKVGADPTDNKIWCGKNSLEVENTLDCVGGSSFTENKGTVGAKGDKPDLESFTFDKRWENAQNVRDTHVDMADEVDDNVADILKSTPTVWCKQKSLQKVKHFDPVDNSPMEHWDIVGRKGVADLENFTFESECDDTGNLERFVAIDLPKNTIDRAKFLERLCRSASLGVPLSHFNDSCSSDEKMGGYHSVPVGMSKQTDLRNITASNAVADQPFEGSHTCTKHENSEFQGNSVSDYSPIYGTQFAWGFKGPYMSPIGMQFEGVTAKSRSSKRGSSNPELTCFPIEESGEEDANADDDDDDCPEESGSGRNSLCSASKEEEYIDVVALDPASKMVSLGSVTTETSIQSSDEQRSEQHLNVIAAQTYQEESASTRQPLYDISNPSSKSSTESFSRASSSSEKNNKIRQNSQAQPPQSETSRQRKENQNFSLGTASAKKNIKSYNTRFSKAKVSVKSVLDNRGGSFSEKEPKPNNIVSSMKSFLPLVKQKQAASCAPVKKEVRVKALEAAEAAKRIAEQKENERKQKKEALKLERARLEQENLRRLELLKKAKVEERKRKDAENAERKRQREEAAEERKERDRKRKRVGETRKQQKGHENKLPMGKEECKSQAEDGKADRQRETNAGKEKSLVGGQAVERVASTSVNNLATSGVLTASGDLTINELRMSSDPCQKMEDVSHSVAGYSTPTPDVNHTSATETIREKSYDISPYCCSDDEEDESNESRNNKFTPSWASNDNIKLTLASVNTLDPAAMFPRSSLDEVLQPRGLKQR